MEINRVTMPFSEIRIAMETMKAAGIYFVAGSSSVYVPSTRTKLIDAAVAREWPDGNGELVPMSPGEAARTEITRLYPNLRKVGWAPGHVKQFDWRPPLYCPGPVRGRFVQYDLTSAYWQVYRWLWLNTPYPMGYGTLPLMDIALRLENWKQARNALIGVIRSRGAVAYKGPRRIDLKTSNNYLSPGLWATVQSVLHCIAVRAIEFGALYINTDGYIFNYGGDSGFKNWLVDHQVNFRLVRQGMGEIVGWANYKVGPYATHLYKIGAKNATKTNAVINPRFDFVLYLERCRKRGDQERGIMASAGLQDSSGPMVTQPSLFDMG